ncbi:WYL domain-containing protein [Empedobacter stercoris]|uniref:helix-turn-helix transcriptional regulator n=1 Tax=Empedobacter TaxID=59734 RepID=UPI0016622ABD|nr:MULTISPECIES: WYL domain-containing protein [Empedobacter]MCA4809353.1 WYL domain-containing protein [Empedobacter stercoris]MDM1522684.1 WYL domain-containing protein [Empedobacter sp. 225-1]MDM1543779.1 WYL domain-containing protein [Empedobacter sp. 189-2]QNT14820.1 WYL domain-containing protein [Empedobacter stercoris]UWX66661.1 WYL domain-containing protein [Empedobacter stercoris]
MSKQGYIARYFNIVRKLSQQKYCSYEDLERFLEREFEMLQLQDDTLEFNFSKRTLQRDIREIRNILGIDIMYSRSQRGYYIFQDDYSSDLFLKTLEEINSFSALKLTNSLESIVYLEKRKPKRAEFLPDIVQAIQQKKKIEFHYQKFGEEKETIRKVSPIAIREHNNRWYLIADDKGIVKNFGLERMNKVSILNDKIDNNIEFNYIDKYKYSFGIIVPSSEKPEKIVLSVTKKQAAYLESLPLHESQQILETKNDEVLIGLELFLTEDFISEILSLSRSVTIIEPKKLKEKVKTILKETLEKYK